MYYCIPYRANFIFVLSFSLFFFIPQGRRMLGVDFQSQARERVNDWATRRNAELIVAAP
jgi:hypothetical protein